jgi:hypothetical protein
LAGKARLSQAKVTPYGVTITPFQNGGSKQIVLKDGDFGKFGLINMTAKITKIYEKDFIRTLR